MEKSKLLKKRPCDKMDFPIKHAEEVWNFLGHEHQIEVRIGLGSGRAVSKFANSPKELAAIINEHNGRHQIWVGVNERKLGGTKNEEVIAIRNAALDIEPKALKSGEVATEQQFQTCLEVVNKIKKWCSARGIPTLAVSSGGKGFHLFFPLDIKIDDKNRGEIAEKYRLFYEFMRQNFETADVKIDTTSDPARVIGCPYTIHVHSGRVRKPEQPLERLSSERSNAFLLSLKRQQKKFSHAPLLTKGDFPCWSELSRGNIAEGFRHYAALFLACHLRDQKLTWEAVEAFLTRWWQRLPQPPETKERRTFDDILKTAKDAYARGYRVGCKNIQEKFPALCSLDCPLRRRRKWSITISG